MLVKLRIIRQLWQLKEFNEKVRSCLHARTINKTIKRGTFPTPILEYVLDGMSSEKVFWKIDLKEVYRQIHLHKHSIKVTNFHCENDVYRFKRLCYHINNSFENVNVKKLFGALYLSVEIYTKLNYKKNSITKIVK